jgi:hypothetical protein
MNYQDIIAQALRAGFGPGVGGNPSMARVGQYEVNPYMEMMGQSEQDIGTPQQMGYSVSTPLGGTRYRTDVVDMDGNLLRSNVHDAGSDKYGLGDMAKLAAFAVGANALGSAMGQPSMFSNGGLLGGAEAAAAGEAGGAGFGVGGGSSTLTPAAIEAGLGTPGYGFNASAAASGMFDPATIGAGAGLAFGPAAAGTLAGAGSGALTSAAGAGAAGGLLKAALPIAGAVLGGTSGGKDTTATTTKDMDPRLANYVYGADGTGGLLGSATKLFNDQMATGGLNELQRQGLDMQKSYLTNPAYAQGYTNMMNVGQGLLGGGVAGNPFRR